MSELLPYEEQLAGRLANIPLPDEDKGWDAMRKMLDDDDDDGVVPPPVNTGCRRWGMGMLLLLLLGGITWGVYKMYIRGTGGTTRDSSLPVDKRLGTQKDSSIANGGIHDRNDTVALDGDKDKQDTFKAAEISHAAKTLRTNSTNVTASKTTHNNGNTAGAINKTTIVSKATARFTSKSGEINAGGTDRTHVANNKGAFAVKSKNGEIDGANNALQKGKGALDKTTTANGDKDVALNNAVKKDKNTNTSLNSGDSNGASSITGQPTSANKNGLGDSSKAPNAGEITSKTSLANKQKTAKKDSSANKPTDDKPEKTNNLYLSAGLALQQLIPVDGQKTSPYNAFGRKGSLADYIPSAYFRAHLNHAFLQIEFKYGAPQDTKNIAYSTKVISRDSTTGITTSQVNSVNKTYYHQLPISIHYEVLPNLSIGAGAVWNKFQSAVVTQQNQSSNPNTGTDSIISSKIISVKKDSASSFAKTYWQFMLEAQYSWRRFSLGARYAWGITPYLTATSSSGQTQKERNASLNVFIRYELWRSKKK